MENSDYIAIASGLIALAAFGVAIWQGYSNRKHYILSVKPKLHIDKNYIGGLHYSLENHGLGPAIIKKITILVNGEGLDDPTEDPWNEIFKSIGVSGINYDFHIPPAGSAFSQNSSRQLLSVTFANNSTNRDDLKIIDKAINYRIEYQSMYENELLSCKVGD